MVCIIADVGFVWHVMLQAEGVTQRYSHSLYICPSGQSVHMSIRSVYICALGQSTSVHKVSLCICPYGQPLHLSIRSASTSVHQASFLSGLLHFMVDMWDHLGISHLDSDIGLQRKISFRVKMCLLIDKWFVFVWCMCIVCVCVCGGGGGSEFCWPCL